MNTLQYLEDIFVKFQRINQILKDNWRDNTQNAFDNNYLTPIATEWSMYHSSVLDLKSRITSAQKEITDGISEIYNLFDRINTDDCRLNGNAIFSIICQRDIHQFTRYFIIDESEIHHLDDEDLSFIAMGRFPSVDEYENPSMVETIYIK